MWPGAKKIKTHTKCKKKTKKKQCLNMLRWISFFYAKLWAVTNEKPMVKKVWKKYEKSCGGLPSSPKSKRGGQAFGILAIPTTPIVGGLWGAFSRHVCPVTASRNDNLTGQRPQTANSISCTRLARSTAAVASIERTLNLMRDHRLRDHVQESCGQGERRRLMHLTFRPLLRSGLLGENG